MEQIIKQVFGADFGICIHNTKPIVKELNKDGFELTFMTTQSDNNKYSDPTHAILVFTKK